VTETSPPILVRDDIPAGIFCCKSVGLWKLGCSRQVSNLASEAVESAALALEGVHDVHGGNGLPASVLGVGDGIADDVLEENLEHRASLLVDETRDTLHTTTASETADSGLGDTLDVVTENLPVTLGAALAKALTTLATSRHVAFDAFPDSADPRSNSLEPRVPASAVACRPHFAGCHLPPPCWLEISQLPKVL
jgi:hypothetical protein